MSAQKRQMIRDMELRMLRPATQLNTSSAVSATSVDLKTSKRTSSQFCSHQSVHHSRARPDTSGGAPRHRGSLQEMPDGWSEPSSGQSQLPVPPDSKPSVNNKDASLGIR